MSTNLQVSLDGRVLRIELNRPEKRNALSLAMCRELIEVLDRAERDDAIGAVLLTAAGSVFCAGMDLDEALEGSAAEHARVHRELFTAGARMTTPVVAAVSGPALGGGAGLVANAHIAVAAQGSTFGLTEIRLGMWPFMVHRAMVRAIGERRALELALTGRIFSATEALEWGLVHHVVPAFELEDRAWGIAFGLSVSSADAIRRGMAFVNESREMNSEAALELAELARQPVFEGVDFREGVRAFREKRKPVWPSLG
ncbi:MAG: enoyl-CoA hydratase/isomerase family protein [Rhodospirillales bacterium]